MAKERKIYEKNVGYTVLKPIVDWCCRHSYRKCEVVGEENIPTDGPVIFAANHSNTLMDALVVLRAHKGLTVFGARADMFNNSFIAKLMFFFRILPMVRQRDGLRNVLKNVETQETIVEILENDVAFCMFPEGRHRPEKSLLSLGKGVFRAALAANAKFGDKKPVYIVPVGIEYGDFFRYRGTALVTFGRPVNITEFIKGLDTENEAQMMEPMRKELAARMSELFTFIPDGEHLKEKWVLTKMIATATAKKQYGNFGTSLYTGMMRNREIIASIEKACAEHPEKMEDLFKDVAEFDRYRRKDGISIYSFRRNNDAATTIGKAFAALIGLPYFLFSSLASLPMWVLEQVIRRKVRDRAFRNTVSFGIKLGLGLISIPVLAIIAFCLAPWYIAAGLILLTIPSYSYFHDYIEGMRRFISDIRIIRCKKLRKRFKSIVKDFNNL
jgi:1-acyl-sn-glycerol-3-phosphate acyltransferase